jgi:hypothetical protein
MLSCAVLLGEIDIMEFVGLDDFQRITVAKCGEGCRRQALLPVGSG